MRLRVTLATTTLGLVLAVTLATPAHAVPDTWTPAVEVSTGTGRAMAHQIAAAPDGSLTAVWQRNDGTDEWLESAVSSDNGLTWTAPAVISGPDNSDSAPQIVIDSSGMRTVVWSRNAEITVSRSADGLTWTAPLVISPPPPPSYTYVNSFDPQLDVRADGTIAVVWHSIGVLVVGGSAFPGSSFVSGARFDGTTWTTGVISAPAGDIVQPDVAFLPSGDAVAIWSAEDLTSVMTSVSTDGGATWAAPTTISGPGLQSGSGGASVRLLLDTGGRIVAHWSARFGGQRVAQVSTSADGSSWSTPVTFTPAIADSDSATIAAAPDGTLHAVWIDNTASAGVVRTARSTDGGATWTAPVDVSGPLDGTFAAAIGFDAQSHPTIVWDTADATDHLVVEAATSLDGGATYAAPVVLSTSSVPLTSRFGPPQLVVSAAGVYTALWAGPASSTLTLQAATGTAITAAPAALADTGVTGEIGVLGLGLLAAGLLVAVRRRGKSEAPRPQ